MKSLINVTDLGVLSVIGDDATTFLQGQATCDVKEVVENTSNLGAFCNPQGKVIAIFLITKIANGFLLILPKTILPIVQEVLEQHKLRAKVEITEAEHPLIAKYLEPTTLRTPWILPETSERFIPQALKLEETGAISLTKGCYTGQEIVVRTHYLGEVKRQLTLAFCDPSASIETDCAIIDESDEKVGNVLLAQVRGLPYKVKDKTTGDVIETTTVNKMMVLCVLNTELANSTLRVDNATKDVLKIVDGRK